MAKEPCFIHLPLCSNPLNKSYRLEGITMYYLSQSCTLSWAALLGLASASQDGAEVFQVALAAGAMARAGISKVTCHLLGPLVTSTWLSLFKSSISFPNGMATGFQKVAFQVNKTRCSNVYKHSAYISLANVLLANTSQVAKPMVNMRGTTCGHKHQEAGPAMGQSTIDP